jgi:ligand-binding SRPBCC domain-containing protein
MIHVLRTTQVVPAPLEACWDFFSDPRNLARITPPGLDFQIVSEVPAAMHAGLMIEYRVRPLLGLRLRWLTEITHVERPGYFVDEQRVGPYRLWHHEHYFRALEDGRTEMRDVVHYVLPLAPFSEVVHPWLVGPKLRRIFAYREAAVRELFSPGPAASGRVGR